MARSFDDIDVGEVDEFGAYEVTAEEVVSFAEQYDPQSMHTDPEVAAEGPFGGLIASGWHTAAITMRLMVEHLFSEMGNAVGKGIDELRWRDPVRPGDVLSVKTTVVAKELDERGRGSVRTRVETRRADGTVVQSMYSNAFYPEAGPAAATGRSDDEGATD